MNCLECKQKDLEIKNLTSQLLTLRNEFEKERMKNGFYPEAPALGRNMWTGLDHCSICNHQFIGLELRSSHCHCCNRSFVD